MVEVIVKSESDRAIGSYEEETIEDIHNFKYLAVDIPNQHTWDKCLNKEN